jgi:lambda family phage tail tape measure protein
MVEFGATIKLDSASALEQMRKFAEQTTAASKTLRQFQNETKATAQGVGANVFRAYINSSQRANQQILKSITLLHDQKKAFSKLSDEEKQHVMLADKLNQKYDESARVERKLVNIRKELRIVTAAGLKTQKEADAIFNREAESLKKSTRAYKEKTNATKRAFDAGRRNLNAIREARIAHDKEFAISRKVAVVKKQLILLLKNEIITRRQYNNLLTESRAKITAVVNENHKLISAQQRMIIMARLVSVYSRLLLGAYAAVRAVRMWVDFEKTAEAVSLLDQKLAFLTGDSGAYSKLFDMTQEVGIKMESANKIITRFAVVTNRAFSIETMSEWSGTLVKSARATGTSTQEMTGALIQITQAMSAGRLMGDEYRSVTENLPLLTVALRDIFGRSTASLKELSSQGLITNEVMIEAFGRTKELLQGFPDSTDTIEAALGRMSSAWDNFVNQVSDTSWAKNAANEIAESLNFFAEKSKKDNRELIENRVKGMKWALENAKKYLKAEEDIRKKSFAEGIDPGFSEQYTDLISLVAKYTEGLKKADRVLNVLNKTTKEDIAKKRADELLQAERERDRIYKEQQKTLQMIERIQGGKSIATIKMKSTLEQNLLEQKHDMFNVQKAGAIQDEEYFLLSEAIAKKKKLSIVQVVQKEIDAELRLNGFTTKNNIGKIQQDLKTTGKITAIRNKAEKDRLTIASAAEARRIGLSKPDYDPSKISKVTAEIAKSLTTGINKKELAEIKAHIDGITASINSVGNAALANTAKLKGDITTALGFEKASIISNYEKSLVELDKKIKQLGNSNEFLLHSEISLSEYRKKHIVILKEQKEAMIFKKDEDFVSSLEQKFDNGAAAVRVYNTEIIALTAAKDRLNLSEFEHNRQLEILKKNMEDQVNQSMALRGELNQFEQVYNGINKGIEDFALNTQTTYEFVAMSTETLMDSMVNSIVIGGKEGEDAFKKMTLSILADIQRMIIKSLILKAIGMFTGNASGISGVTAGSQQDKMLTEQNLGFAKGGVKSGPGISNYSNTVVNKPTIFPFAKGTGLMGEDGEEAIMPLTRLPSGNLGVETTGSGHSGDNNVTITVKIDQSGNVEQSVTSRENDGAKLGGLMAAVVNKQLIKEMRPGGLLNRSGG